MPVGKPKPRSFAAPEKRLAWFREHHRKADELWVGHYKKGSGQASVTWPESADEALRCGWVDGTRKSVDDTR